MSIHSNITVSCFGFAGLPRDLAYRLASQTVLGSGQLVRDSGVHPGKLKDDVTSPAGSTAAGLWHLEANGMYLNIKRLVYQPTTTLFFQNPFEKSPIFSVSIYSGWCS